VLKVTLPTERLLLTVSYTEMGEQDVLVAAAIILLGEQSPCSPVSRAYVSETTKQQCFQQSESMSSK